ncbi:hypothetical protein BDW22DRAFT_1426547 [Trametopsis cervina]|nr:hypothetical protein BDW22DRAFT_1426547 [Trametopsis cervina]
MPDLVNQHEHAALWNSDDPYPTATALIHTLQALSHTVTDVADAAADEPPRKRQRTQELADVDLAVNMSASEYASASSSMLVFDKDVVVVEDERHPECERDERFYLAEGDCVVRVENTLFKAHTGMEVHRFILSRDSSAFEHMFGISDQRTDPQSSTEGTNDRQPLMLFHETAENFKLLLSILYALPAEIQQYSTADADVPTLLTIAEMTNKYSFITTSNWAIKCLHTVFKEGTLTNQWNPTLCRSSLFKRIIEVAILCGHQELCDFAVKNWVDRILNRTANPLIAMAVADKHGLVHLQGVSYYVALLESGPNFEWKDDAFGAPEPEDELSSADGPQPPLELTPAQKARLLSGFFALANLWDRLRIAAPTFTRPDGCTYHAHGCVGTWQHTWHVVARSEVIAKLPPADVVGRLKAMQDMLIADPDIAHSLTPVCRRTALVSVKELIRRVQSELASYFQDLTLPRLREEESVVAVAGAV